MSLTEKPATSPDKTFAPETKAGMDLMAQSKWEAGLQSLISNSPSDAASALQRAEHEGLKAICLFQLGREKEACAMFEQALAICPTALQTRYNYAFALYSLGKLEEADPHYEKVLDQDPTHEAALAAYCAALEHRTDGLMQIERLCKRALAIKPDSLAAELGLVQAEHLGLKQEQGLARLEKLIAKRPRDLSLLTRYYMHAGYSDRVPPERFTELHRNYGRLWMQQAPEPPFDRAAMIAEHRAWRQAHPDAPLRVGILSSEAYLHPIGQLLASFLPDINSKRAQVTLYGSAKVEDEVTQAIAQSGVRWVEIKAMSDVDLAQRIRADGIDVLVDANGVTGQHRLGALAMRCAPVQLAWAGYVYSTGLPTMDGYIADATTSAWPAERFFKERIYRLPECVYCYRPVMKRPIAAPSPALKNGFVSFGSFNHLVKVNTTTLDLWASVLQAVPNSKIVAKAATLSDSDTQARFVTALGQRGIMPNRIIIGRPSLHAEYLQDFERVDIMLDCVPFNGGMTTLESLWQGVPLLAIAGITHASRVGVSIMRAAGLTDWIATTPQEYVAKARALTQDLQGLAQLRASLQATLPRTPLGNTQRYAAQMVAVWEDAWNQALSEI